MAGVKDMDDAPKEATPPPSPKGPTADNHDLEPGEQRGILERVLYRGSGDRRHFHVLPARVSHSRRAQRAIAVTAVALVLFGAWWWVIPHADLTVRVQYHEGLFNTIAVDLRVNNGGSVAAAPMRLELMVTDNKTGQSMGSINASRVVGAHSVADFDPVEFKGDQIATGYNIAVTLHFDVGDGLVTKAFDFRTVEPFMNLYFDARAA